MSRDNRITTGKVAGATYDLRHWKLAALVACLMGLGRYVSGQDLWRGGRSTDATFFCPASRRRGWWWANLPGWLRAAVRLSPAAGLWAYFTHQAALVAAGVALVAICAYATVRTIRARRHERRVLQPFWPAVAHIIGVDRAEHPSAWLDIPEDPAEPIAVGLLPHTFDDDQQVQALLTLFNQRTRHEHVATTDHAARLALLHLRPADPPCWPAIARVVGADPGEPSGQWLAMPGDPTQPGAQVMVRLPDDEIAEDRIGDQLKELLAARFRGSWNRRTDPTNRTVVLTRAVPDPEPPRYIRYDPDTDENAVTPRRRNHIAVVPDDEDLPGAA